MSPGAIAKARPRLRPGFVIRCTSGGLCRLQRGQVQALWLQQTLLLARILPDRLLAGLPVSLDLRSNYLEAERILVYVALYLDG